jgi:hypothetical protein
VRKEDDKMGKNEQKVQKVVKKAIREGANEYDTEDEVRRVLGEQGVAELAQELGCEADPMEVANEVARRMGYEV